VFEGSNIAQMKYMLIILASTKKPSRPDGKWGFVPSTMGKSKSIWNL